MPDTSPLAARVAEAPDRVLWHVLSGVLFGQVPAVRVNARTRDAVWYGLVEEEWIGWTDRVNSIRRAEPHEFARCASDYPVGTADVEELTAAGAEAVIEAMTDEGWTCHQTTHGPDCTERRRSARFSRGRLTGPEVRDEHKMPKAVSIAAILALAAADALPAPALSLLSPDPTPRTDTPTVR